MLLKAPVMGGVRTKEVLITNYMDTNKKVQVFTCNTWTVRLKSEPQT